MVFEYNTVMAIARALNNLVRWSIIPLFLWVSLAIAADPNPLPGVPANPLTGLSAETDANPPASQPNLSPARTLMKAGKLDEALKQVTSDLATHPKNVDALFLESEILTRLKKMDDAILVLRTMTEQFPELVVPYNNLAVLYAGQGRLEEARKTLEMAVSVQPDYATAYENLGDVYRALALSSYDKALRLQPSNLTLKAKAQKFK